MKSLSDVEVGDVVYRYLGGTLEMPLTVSRVDSETIYCAIPGLENSQDPSCEGWTFDRNLGYELDEELGWGKQPNGTVVTGSYIQAERKANHHEDVQRSA